MLTGSCLCGAIAYEADAQLTRIVHCHCQTCRKTHSAAFSSVTAVPREAFRWTRGSDLLGAFESSPGKFRRFCTRCGSHLMAERVAQPVVLLRLGCLDTRRSPTGRRSISGAPTARPGTTRRRRSPSCRRGCHEPAGRRLPSRSTRTSVAAQASPASAPDGRRSGRSCPSSTAPSSRCCPTCSPRRSMPRARRSPRCCGDRRLRPFARSGDLAHRRPARCRRSGRRRLRGRPAGRPARPRPHDAAAQPRQRPSSRRSTARHHRRGRAELRQLRAVHPDPDAGAARTRAPATEALSALDDAARHAIETADTFFVASRSRAGIETTAASTSRIAAAGQASSRCAATRWSCPISAATGSSTPWATCWAIRAPACCSSTSRPATCCSSRAR